MLVEGEDGPRFRSPQHQRHEEVVRLRTPRTPAGPPQLVHAASASPAHPLRLSSLQVDLAEAEMNDAMQQHMNAFGKDAQIQDVIIGVDASPQGRKVRSKQKTPSKRQKKKRHQKGERKKEKGKGKRVKVSSKDKDKEPVGKTVCSSTPTKRQSTWLVLFTPLAISLNLGVFLMSLHRNQWKLAASKINPFLGAQPSVLLDCGAKLGPFSFNKWWNIFTPVFAVAGIYQLCFNLWILVAVGRKLEKALGFFYVGGAYILSGVMGSMVALVCLPNQLSVMSTAAALGLIGFAFSTKMFALRETPRLLWWLCYVLVVMGLLGGLMPLQDDFSLLTGLVTGFLFGVAGLDSRIKGTGPFGLGYSMRAFFIAFFLAACFLILLLLLFSGIGVDLQAVGCFDSDMCRWLSCMDNVFWSCSESSAQELRAYLQDRESAIGPTLSPDLGYEHPEIHG
eukprot:g32478.t1